MACEGCDLSELQVIKLFWQEGEASLQLFEEHGILPITRECGNCGRQLSLDGEKQHFRCYKRFRPDPKSKKEVRCSYYASRLQGTWLEKAKLPPGTIIVFVSAFLRKHYTQKYFRDNLGMACHTIVDWQRFCSEVCENWLEAQEPIGGPGKVVEIDEWKLGKKRIGRIADKKALGTGNVGGGKALGGGAAVFGGVWVFGGIERETKNHFIIPIDNRTSATLLPLCQKYILRGTTIFTHSRTAYSNLASLGYTHTATTNADTLLDPEVHTRTIERVRDGMKGFTLHAGSKRDHYRQYLARYLYCYSHPDHKTILHHFLTDIARFFPPPQ